MLQQSAGSNPMHTADKKEAEISKNIHKTLKKNKSKTKSAVIRPYVTLLVKRQRGKGTRSYLLIFTQM